MIPVLMKAEPVNFDSDVRKKGNDFLAITPDPTVQQWNSNAYWQRVIPEMRTLYGYTCAYCAVKIPKHTGEPTVDHFIPKDVDPTKAYEWSNYRLASKKFNTRKSTMDIIDPFDVKPGWFVIDFDTFLILPNNNSSVLPDSLYELVNFTIEQLRLNFDDDLVYERIDFIREYVNGEYTFSFLEKFAPFIAYELKRQGLVDLIKTKTF